MYTKVRDMEDKNKMIQTEKKLVKMEKKKSQTRKFLEDNV